MTLKEHIRQSGEKQTAWAERLDIGRSYLSDILSGKKLPSLELASRIELATNGAIPAGSWHLGDKAVPTPVVDAPQPGSVEGDAALPAASQGDAPAGEALA